MTLAIKRHPTKIMRSASLLLALAICAPLLGAPKINYEWRTVSGKGLTEEQAVSKALMNAVEQVNGGKIDGATIAIEEMTTRSGESNTYSSTTSESSFKRKGIVRSYEILGRQYDTNENSWKVILTAEVIDLRIGDGRKSMSVLELASMSPEKNKFAKQLTNEIESKLTASRKFLVLESKYDPTTKDFIKSITENPLLSPVDSLMLENGLPPDLILRGEVHEAKISFNNAFPSGNIDLLVPYASVKLNYQVIQPTTSQIKLQDAVSLSFNLNDYNKLKKRATENNIDVLTAELTAKIMVKKILDAIYPVILTSVSKENQVTLNFGKDFISSGQKYDIYQREESIYDPYIKENITWDQRLIGEVLITRTLPKISFGLLDTNEKNLYKSFEDKKFVAYLKPQTSAPKRTIDTKKKVESMVTELENEY